MPVEIIQTARDNRNSFATILLFSYARLRGEGHDRHAGLEGEEVRSVVAPSLGKEADARALGERFGDFFVERGLVQLGYYFVLFFVEFMPNWLCNSQQFIVLQGKQLELTSPFHKSRASLFFFLVESGLGITLYSLLWNSWPIGWAIVNNSSFYADNN